ncbi:hypothetical protein BGZ52_006465 [Haplosporangium bisporale]|nr:hypothetical protein BGZ52_006465 [Haplosporangium bisporale]
MRKSLLLVLLGLLASAGRAAPCFESMAADQASFFNSVDEVGLMPLSDTVHSASELNAQMQRLIDREMSISYNQGRYLEELKKQACRFYIEYGNVGIQGPLENCIVDVLTPPRIELIPTRRLSQDIHCTTQTCIIGYHDQTTVATTHSVEVGFSVETSAAPFGMGVTFTASASYGFSTTNEQSTTFSYEFQLEKGESGYIGVVSVQISAKIRRRGFARLPFSVESIDETAYHESVIMESNKPRSIVAFVHQ